MLESSVWSEVQKSAAAHEYHAKALCAVWKKKKDEFEEQLTACIRLSLTIAKITTPCRRLYSFFGTFLKAATDDNGEEGFQLLERILTELCECTRSSNKTVRQRACTLIGDFLNRMGEDVELLPEVSTNIMEHCLARTEDKVAQIRAAAAFALKRLVLDPSDVEEDDEAFDQDDRELVAAVAERLEHLLFSDKSAEVRKAALQALVPSDHNRALIVQATNDESSSVRCAAFNCLRPPLTFKFIAMSERATLLRRGLNDRVAAVRAAAAAQVASWFASVDLSDECLRPVVKEDDDLPPIRLIDAAARYPDCDALQAAAKVVLLLYGIDINIDCEEEGRLLVNECLRAGHLDPVALSDAATRFGLGLSGGGATLHCNEEALLWRCVCLWLSEDASSRAVAASQSAGAPAAVEAAAAGQRLDALEQLLPATAEDTLELILAHATAQPPLWFSACCLIDVACACVDFADANARGSAARACERLVSCAKSKSAETFEKHCPMSSGGDGTWERCVVRLAARACSETEDLLSALLPPIMATCPAAMDHMPPAMRGSLQPAASDPDALAARLGDVALVDDTGSVLTPPEMQQKDPRVSAGQAAVLSAETAVVLMAFLSPLLARTTGEAITRAEGGHAALEAVLLHVVLPAAAGQVPGSTELSLRLAMQCLGHFVIIDVLQRRTQPRRSQSIWSPGLPSMLHMLRTALCEGENEELSVQTAAAQALLDVCLLMGARAVDELTLGASDFAAADSTDTRALLQLSVSDLLLDRLAWATLLANGDRQHRMHADCVPPATDMVYALVSGLAKLLIHYNPASERKTLERGDAVRTLMRLLATFLNATGEKCCKARQLLAVFFDAFAVMRAANKALLADALVGAARLVLADSLQRTQAPLLVRFVQQRLLQPLPAAATSAAAALATAAAARRGADGGGVADGDGDEEGDGAADGAAVDASDAGAAGPSCAEDWVYGLQVSIHREAMVCPRSPLSRPYLTALLKLSAALPFRGLQPRQLALIQLLMDRTLAVLQDEKALSKELASARSALNEAVVASRSRSQQVTKADASLTLSLQNLSVDEAGRGDAQSGDQQPDSNDISPDDLEAQLQTDLEVSAVYLPSLAADDEPLPKGKRAQGTRKAPKAAKTKKAPARPPSEQGTDSDDDDDDFDSPGRSALRTTKMQDISNVSSGQVAAAPARKVAARQTRSSRSLESVDRTDENCAAP